MGLLEGKAAVITGGSSGIGRTAALAFAREGARVSNAGAFRSLAEFDAVAVDLKGVWLCLRREIRQMLAQSPRGGAIVNTSSLNGLGGAPSASLYSACKAGVLALAKSAAMEYAPHGIRVNAVVPGAFRTPMLESVFDRVAGGEPAAREAVEKRYTERIPLGRIGRPEETAEAVVWLRSEAAFYVTGHSMIVDGGWTAPVR